MGFHGTAPAAKRGVGDRIATLLVVPLAVALTLLLIIFFVLHTTTTVSGDSMLPGLLESDRLLITRGYELPSRGDVVVIDAKPYEAETPNIVKRVVALSGDEVRVVDGTAYVNDIPESGYETLGYQGMVGWGSSMPTLIVPEGHVFVLGDNRPISFDSRVFGPVPIEYVIGEVVWVFAPITRFGAID